MNAFEQIHTSKPFEQFNKFTPRELRREMVAHILQKVWPIEVHDPYNVFKTADYFLRHGFGLVGISNHFSMGDPARVLTAWIQNAPAMHNRELVAPVAWHQRGAHDLQTLGKVADLTLPGIVTPDTKQHELELIEANQLIPWEIRPQGAGLLDFAKASTNVLEGDGSNKGLVVYAPHAQRTDSFIPFPLGSITTLDRLTVKRGINDSIAYVFYTLHIPGNTDYSREAVGKSNRGVTYVLDAITILPAWEFREQARFNGRTLEEEAHAIMLPHVPEAYRPKAA